MSDLRQMAVALGGRVVGDHVECPGPGHSRKDHSLSVWPAPSKRRGPPISIFSRAGDDWKTAIDHAARLLD